MNILYFMPIGLGGAAGLWWLAIARARSGSNAWIVSNRCADCGYSREGLARGLPCPECRSTRVATHAPSLTEMNRDNRVIRGLLVLVFAVQSIAMHLPMSYNQPMAAWFDVSHVAMSWAHAAILNACALITTLVGSIVCLRRAPRRRVRLVAGACAAMVVAQAVCLVLQHMTGLDEGFPFWWLMSVWILPIASGLGAIVSAWSVPREE